MFLLTKFEKCDFPGITLRKTPPRTKDYKPPPRSPRVAEQVAYREWRSPGKNEISVGPPPEQANNYPLVTRSYRVKALSREPD